MPKPSCSRTRRLAVVLAIVMVAILAPTSAATTAGAIDAPIFEAPWECGKTMLSATRPNHGLYNVDFEGYPPDFDSGLDIGNAERGAPVLATAAGVSSAKWGSGLGHYAEIDHGNGWASIVAHLENAPTSGPVSKGQQIGTIGDSGNATGSHIHMAIMLDGVNQPIAFGGEVIPVKSFDGGSDQTAPPILSENCGDQGDAPIPDPVDITVALLADEFIFATVHEVRFTGTGTDVVAGDFDGDGDADLAQRVANRFELRTVTSDDLGVIGYGKVGDQVFIGDWDCDGDDTFAVRRGNVFFLKNTVESGNADTVIGYGRAADEVFVGDWNGNGCDTFAVRRQNEFFVRNTNTTGVADTVFAFGQAADTVMVGDWNADGFDTFAVRRAADLFLRDDLETG
ncbi:MAG: M23 family metallopeptidase, partial [Acidimicrobiia bacterium]|nr:M23 family metallopeptidase [Acidimicrobiia bacterium]